MFLLSAKAIVIVALAAGLPMQPSGGGRCESHPNGELYLMGPVDGFTPALIADTYLNERLLPQANESLRSFWQEFGTSDKDVASLVASWNASPDAKSAVTTFKDDIENLRLLRATIIAFEETRPTPEQAAEILTGARAT